MSPRNTDRDWELYGRRSPYFGVLAQEKYLPERLDEAAVADFFASGEEHIEQVVALIRKHIVHEFEPQRCLDFGCGVGRLAFPLARRFQSVVGVDVSSSMIDEARRNSEKYGVRNAAFVASDDGLSTVTGKFDFIHSFIVMQHISKDRGERLLARLIENLNPGGVGAIHFTYSWDDWLRQASPTQRVWRWVRESLPLVHNLANLARGRKFDHPFMQMNVYDVNELFGILQRCGCEHAHVQFTNHDGHGGVMILFQRP